MFVMIDGPFSDADANSDWDEIPTWFVGVCDDDGDPVDDATTLTCFSKDAAWTAAEDLANPRGLEIIDDSSPL